VPIGSEQKARHGQGRGTMDVCTEGMGRQADREYSQGRFYHDAVALEARPFPHLGDGLAPPDMQARVPKLPLAGGCPHVNPICLHPLPYSGVLVIKRCKCTYLHMY
jgi:hypothetical protein